jgi:hypothetical protein
MHSSLCQPRLAVIVVAAFLFIILLTELATPPETVRRFSHLRSKNPDANQQISEMNSTLGVSGIRGLQWIWN